MAPNHFTLHAHGGRIWFAVRDPESWQLIVASPAIYDTPSDAARAAIAECHNLVRACNRHTARLNLQGVSAL